MTGNPDLHAIRTKHRNTGIWVYDCPTCGFTFATRPADRCVPPALPHAGFCWKCVLPLPADRAAVRYVADVDSKFWNS